MLGPPLELLLSLSRRRRSFCPFRGLPGSQHSEGSEENILGVLLRQVFFLNQGEDAQRELKLVEELFRSLAMRTTGANEDLKIGRGRTGKRACPTGHREKEQKRAQPSDNSPQACVLKEHNGG
jgi:hypothetical protein